MCEMKELELYLHIPFCVCKCNYCDFLSAPAEAEMVEAYVDAMVREINAYRGRFEAYRVISVFFGGGTPSLLQAEQIQRIMEALRSIFLIDAQAEVTMEMNPGTVAPQKLDGYRAAGINRLSIGLQSVNDGELKMLGRIHDYRTFLDTYHLAREKGFENINIDLISAIPGQTPESWKRTLRTVAELSPEHISAYSLIIEERTLFYEWYQQEPDPKQEKMPERKPLPDEEEERQMYEDTEEILREYGYHRYEISNYAKEGRECRHNLGYWERKEYLGIGTGSASLIGNTRFDHIRDTKEYIRLAKEPDKLCAHTEALTREDEMEEFMFLGLRKIQGICTEEFQSIFGCGIDEIYGKTLQILTEQGLIECDKDSVRLTKRGIDISNYVLAQFLLE